MTLILSSQHLQAIVAQAKTSYPEECCGLLLGQMDTKSRTVTEIWPTANSWDGQVAAEMRDMPLTTEQRYWIAPQEMLAAMRYARRQNLEVIGVYHSHPHSPAVPSECDRQLAWSDYVYVIASLMTDPFDPVTVDPVTVKNITAWVLDDQQQFQPEEIRRVIAGFTSDPLTMGKD